MTQYIDVQIVTDPDELASEAYDFIQAQYPDWVPNAGNLDTWLIEAVARMAAEAATVASSVPASIFRYFGPLAGINPINATPASITSTWTMVDNAGYTIPAGTLVGIASSGNVIYSFGVLNDVIVPPGETVTDTGGVTLVATVAGAASSDLGAMGVAAQLQTVLSFVTGITLTGPTSGGADAEDDATYLNRLAAELQLLSPRPILPKDFAVEALNIGGVARALALDLYTPAFNEVQTISVNATGGTYTLTFGANTTGAIAWNAIASAVQTALTGLGSIGAGNVTVTGGPGGTLPLTVTFVGALGGAAQALITANSASLTGGTHTATIAEVVHGAAAATNVPRACTVAVADANGNALSSAVMAEVEAALQAEREVNFLVYVIPPTYTEVDVGYEIVALPNFDADAVVAGVNAQLAIFINPANWGLPPGGDQSSWVDTETLRLLDVAAVIKNTQGVAYIVSGTLKLALHGGGLTAADVALTGPAAMPTLGTVTGSHT